MQFLDIDPTSPRGFLVVLVILAVLLLAPVTASLGALLLGVAIILVAGIVFVWIVTKLWGVLF